MRKYNIKWSIVEKVHWKTKVDHCPQCLAEKLHLKNILMTFHCETKEVNLLMTVNIQINYYLKV